MSTVFDVIVCGSLHLDIVVHAPALPRVDETAVGSSWAQVCGGKGGNQAVQAARAGARTAMIGRIGDDAFGKTMRAHLQAVRVDHSQVMTDPHVGSGMSVAIQQNDGEYGAVIVSGSNLKIESALLSAQWAALGGAKVLVLQNEVPHAVNVAAAKVARSAGAKVVFNAAPARPLDQELLSLVDVLVVNRIEAEALCGGPVTTRAEAVAAMPKLSRHGDVVVTLGGQGLVVCAAGGVIEIAPVPVTVTSTHGAGDCFVGVLAAQVSNDVALLQACHTANARAAEFVSR